MRYHRPRRPQSRVYQHRRKSGFRAAGALAGYAYELVCNNGGAAAMSGQSRAWRAADDGAAAAEAAVIMTALLLLVCGSIEFAQALWTNNTMLLAVEQAGRYAMVHNRAPAMTCVTQTQASRCPALSRTPIADCAASAAAQVLSAYKAPNIAVSASEDTTSNPATITICATYSFGFLVPQLLPFDLLELNVRVTVPLI
jgi:Flp pilus assembly protein TadG